MSTSVLSSLKVIARPKIEPKPRNALSTTNVLRRLRKRKLRTLKQVKSPLSADPPLFDRGITIATNTTILK